MEFTSELKAKWLEALRSGEYKQTTGVMYESETDGYCCLGVLAICTGRTDTDIECETFITNGSTYDVLNADTQRTLAGMNDNGKSFETIADYIEENILAHEQI